ncbi:hypothetical protein WKI68_13045 [Streptomyces sp. MS1.HAVA.3]|uniref:Transposase n=1 Tax=Streptomyces caledonius TaxID=3134107 RepID=A0ABU8U2Q3_9ACTN
MNPTAIRTTGPTTGPRPKHAFSRLRRMVGWILEEAHGVGVVEVPPVTTFNRLVHALADGQGLLGTAAQRRRHSSRPAPPFTPTVALRPGEMVMLDSTSLDVTTRSICAAVLRPVGTCS